MSEQPAINIPPECTPQPLPMAWIVQPVQNGFVAITLFDATGQRVVLLQAIDARRLATEVERAATTASTGLIVPGTGLS